MFFIFIAMDGPPYYQIMANHTAEQRSMKLRITFILFATSRDALVEPETAKLQGIDSL